MEIAHQKIVLDINNNDSFEILEMKQGDKGSRYIDVTITADGHKLEISTIATIARFAASNNGILLQNDAFELKTDNTVTVEVSENALSVSGTLECEVILYNNEGERVTSATFYIRVGSSVKGQLGDILNALINVVKEFMISPSAVTSEKIAELAVITEKIANGAVAPEKLDREYLRVYGAQSITGELLHSFLTTNVKESREPDKKIYILDCDGKDALETVGKGRCICLYASSDEFFMHNITSGKQYVVAFSDNEITSVEEVNESKLGEGEVTPANLDRTYLEERSTGALPGDAFHNFLISGIKENGDHLKSVYLFVSRGNGVFETVGVGRCKGFYINNTQFTFENLNTNKVYQVMFTNEKIISFTEKYADIAEGSILRRHLSDGLLIPDEMLEESYWKLSALNPARSYEDLDLLFEDEYAADTIYKITISGLSPMASIVGGGSEHIGIIGVNADIMTLYNRANGELWSYERGSNTIEKIEETASLSVNDPNCHAEYFLISDDGEVSLKPEYRGATSKSTYEASISDMGAGVAGSRNAELPADLIIPEVVEETAVDRLSAGMFLDNTAVESLTFPVTVDEIPACFAELALNLRQIKNTDHIRSVAERALLKCRLEKVVMPNLEEITGLGAFGNNPHLIYADVGKVAELPKHTFAYDLVLSKVDAENVKSVGEQALFDTPRLVNADFLGGLTSVGKAGLWRTGLDYDWSSLTNCTFGTCATSLQANPTDFWSDLTPTPCENPTPTAFCQVDPRWNDRQIGASGKYYGANGCGVFCALHTYCGINNLTLSSVTEFEDIVNAVNPDLLNDYRGTLVDITNILNSLGLNATFVDNAVATWNAEYLSELYDVLASGGYAIVTVGSPEGHAIVIHGVTEKKELIYLDCARKYYYDLSKPCRAKLPFEKLIAHNTDFILVSR